jgi:hypothetical protein
MVPPRQRINRITTWAAGVLLAFAFAGPAPACEHYFVVVFGSQRDLGRPKYTHTFATFVKATGEGKCLRDYRVEVITISWLPQSLDVEPLRLKPECGQNFELHETLRYVISEEEKVSKWGPYPIEKELYDRALKQAAHLQSGEVRYKAADTGYQTSEVSNCIHAVSDLVEERYRLRVASPGWGNFASYVITLRFRPWILDSEQADERVSELLGLGDYDVENRDLAVNPRGALVPAPLRGGRR